MENEHIAKAFDRKSRLALAVVAILVLGSQAVVQPSLIQLTTDGPLINAAGRQRMLSQRLVKAALMLEGGMAQHANGALAELKHVLDLWSASHERLVKRLTATGPAVREGIAARHALTGLQPEFSTMRDAAQRMIEAVQENPPDAASIRVALAAILDHEAEYLGRMDRVVGLLETEARARIESFRRIGWVLTGLILAALGAIGLFIFRPATGLIRRQVAALGRARDELEGRVQERTRELESVRERHRTLVDQLSHVGRTTTLGEMASALAHELKQPLGAIANYAEGCLIAISAPEPALADVRAALERLREATMRSGRIIERVRQFATRQGPNIEAFDPNRVVNEVVELLGVEARQHGVAVALELAPGLPCLWGDPVQIQQVLVNLVRNSLESLALLQTSKPTLVIQTRMLEQSDVEFAVTDNGEGIPTDRHAQIFDAYFSTRARGMGMGLTISRTIVEAHRGRLEVESDPGVRTTFRFRLPTARPDHE
jgi:two-component system sensor kinase FixL